MSDNTLNPMESKNIKEKLHRAIDAFTGSKEVHTHILVRNIIKTFAICMVDDSDDNAKKEKENIAIISDVSGVAESKMKESAGFSLTLEEAIQIIRMARESERKNIIKKLNNG